MALGDVRVGYASAVRAGGMPHVQTTDGSTVALCTIPIPEKFVGVLRITVCCGTSTTCASRMGWTTRILVRNIGGTVTCDTLAEDSSGDVYGGIASGATNPAYPAFSVSTTNIRVDVTGTVGHTLEWFGQAHWECLGQFNS